MSQAVALFRDLDAQVAAGTIHCFLVIASADGDIAMRDLQDRAGMPSSTTSGNVAALSAQHRLGKPGLNLVETYEDPLHRSHKRVRLTAKGRALPGRILDLIA